MKRFSYWNLSIWEEVGNRDYNVYCMCRIPFLFYWSIPAIYTTLSLWHLIICNVFTLATPLLDREVLLLKAGFLFNNVVLTISYTKLRLFSFHSFLKSAKMNYSGSVETFFFNSIVWFFHLQNYFLHRDHLVLPFVSCNFSQFSVHEMILPSCPVVY